MSSLTEEELTPKTLDPYEVAIEMVREKIKTSTAPERWQDGFKAAIGMIEGYAALERDRQTTLMLIETFKKKQ